MQVFYFFLCTKFIYYLSNTLFIYFLSIIIIYLLYCYLFTRETPAFGRISPTPVFLCVKFIYYLSNMLFIYKLLIIIDKNDNNNRK